MVVDRLRLFRGATELDYSEASFSRTDDHIVDQGFAEIGPEDLVTVGSVIDFKQNDGSTTVFSAKVIEKQENEMWLLKILTNGYELNNVNVQQTFTNKSPEFIVEDIITNFTTTLTYVSGVASGVVLDQYIANGYAIDIIRDMMNFLQWRLRIDFNDNVSFEPRATVDNGRSFTNGVGAQFLSRQEDQNNLVNHVRVVGGFENFATEETIVDTNTVFTLTKKPTGVMRIVVSGTEVDSATYTVDGENKIVTFDASKTDPTFFYSFDKPVIVEDQNDPSIAQFGEIFQEIQAPWLNSISDARRYAQNVLDVLAFPLDKVKVMQPGLDFTSDVDELFTLTDTVRNDPAEQFIVTKITYDAAKNTTTYDFGERDFIIFDWQRKVESRIKDIERRLTNQDVVTFARNFKDNMLIELTVTQVNEFNSPVDSFILSHKTLGRLRTSLDFEADCSDSGNNGTWNGTGIAGSQYTTSGFRLSAGTFNGSDNFIDVADVAGLRFTGDFSIALVVKVTPLPGAETWILNKWDTTDGYAVRINASNEVELIYSDTGADTVFAASTALTDNTFQHVVFTKSGTALTVYVAGVSDNTATGGATVGSNTNNLEVGRQGANFFTGTLDEVHFYNRALTADEASKLNSKLHVVSGDVCYMSMDNPRLGDRSSARAPIP